jgi:hypothetical protein
MASDDNHIDSEDAARLHATESARDGIVSIRSHDYDETEAALAADPIIRAMADEIANAGADVDTTGWSFTTAALSEYRHRGGQIGTHIGGPSAAIRLVLAERDKPRPDTVMAVRERVRKAATET